jgi:Mg-chelatase subunit ChlD
MPPSTEAWLHALWGAKARIVVLPPAEGAQHDEASQRPVLTEAGGLTLHLPLRAQSASELASAAASHAAAHWRFGGPPQPRSGLKPVQLALVGVLEDARVEWLALQELPGLRALWLPFHAGEGAPSGMQFDSLLDRLARSLLDPSHRDPHPWVARARAGFFEAGGASLALRTPGDVRAAASRLGNEIGQMRLPFNASMYHPHATYRDDNHHLWQPDETLPDSAQPLVSGASDDAAAGRASDQQPLNEKAVPYPEWDYRIGRYRPAWAHVFQSDAGSPPSQHPLRLEECAALRHRLTRALAGVRAGPPRSDGRASWGDQFHPAALVESRVDQRLRHTPEERVYRRLLPRRASLHVLLLLDASASTAAAGADGTRLLDRMLAVVQACATALERTGHRCAALAFSSRTRHRVDLLKLKDWNDSAEAPAVRARCHGLEPGGSTRTGAAVRHATAWVNGRAGHAADGRRQVLLVTDGEPHDVDVHDPRYLAHDLRRAIAEAGRCGISVCSLTPDVLRRPHVLHAELARLLVA